MFSGLKWGRCRFWESKQHFQKLRVGLQLWSKSSWEWKVLWAQSRPSTAQGCSVSWDMVHTGNMVHTYYGMVIPGTGNAEQFQLTEGTWEFPGVQLHPEYLSPVPL